MITTGKCSCDSVAFQIDGKLSEIIICHCSICRRSTGTNGIAVVIVDNKNVIGLKGKNLFVRGKAQSMTGKKALPKLRFTIT